jgi:hypothetical protein
MVYLNPTRQRAVVYLNPKRQRGMVLIQARKRKVRDCPYLTAA